MKTSFTIAGLALLALSGCKSPNNLGAALRITRSACPAVAVPANTNDITLFNPPAARTADAIDVVATISNLTSRCTQDAEGITVVADFDINARRVTTAGARQVTLPYFATVLRAGTQVQSKSVSRVSLDFADGQARATARGQATTRVSLAAATLPEAVVAKINRKRKAGDPDAALDPMADPEVRAAVSAASFELLVGFQLTTDQLRYNATR